ncbi:MAG TPA: amino acid permease [Candidatus Eisenbacteria bacterium]|nr:amino acid permease [Candidatus Eisenbacteria bacterium]
MAPSGTSASQGPSASPVVLKRQIGLYAATAITIGSIVGSGIFRSPHSVAQELSSAPLMLFAWILGGALSLCGSLVLAELAVAHPETGGLYVFIRRAFGDRLGFVFGWASLGVIKPTVIASITSVFAIYFCEALGLPASTQFAAGAAAILVLTFINWLGVREGAGTQTLLTTLKVIGIAALCAAAFFLPHGGPTEAGAAAVAAGAAAGGPEAAGGAARPLFLAMVVAMIPILFAYDGWTDSTYVAGEIVNPRRNMPIAILLGTVAVVGIYVLTNLAYFAVLTPAEVATYEAVGSETIRRILGDWGGRALAVLVAVSTFGTVSASILTGPRVTLAMAADGLFWKRAAHVDARRGSPDFALWLQAALSITWLWFAGGFEDASGWFVTTSWLFYGVTIAAVFVKRRREARGEVHPEIAAGAAVGYRTPLYPITPILFILVTVVLIGSDLSASGWRAGAGVFIAATGFAAYHLFRRR